MPEKQNTKVSPDILIAGAGIIGLSLALELYYRGARITVLERDTALTHASTAAAGMLAVDDPHHPPALRDLAALSGALYSRYLMRIEHLAHAHVPFQTTATVQYFPDGSSRLLAEYSLDPRQLAAALLAAVRAGGIDLIEQAETHSVNEENHRLRVETSVGIFEPGKFVETRGAWHAPYTRPAKGQMLRVQLPPGLQLYEVHRSEQVYIVPRTAGPNAGSALIGATVEDAGFNLSTHPSDLAHLRGLAAELIPAFADEAATPQLEAWAGLRPVTADYLPVIGAVKPASSHFLATGHFRNGILLAPATAAVVTDLLEGNVPSIDLTPFAPDRFRS